MGRKPSGLKVENISKNNKRAGPSKVREFEENIKNSKRGGGVYLAPESIFFLENIDKKCDLLFNL